MQEQVKVIGEGQEPENENKTVDAKLLEEAMQKVEEVLKGSFDLETPIMNRGEELTEIAFDFTQVTSDQLTNALDRHMSANIAVITPEQQQAVFALAVRGYKGLDEKDMERLAPEDMMVGVFAGEQYLNYLENNAFISRMISWKEGEGVNQYLKRGDMLLEKPITLNGTEYKTITYDFSRMIGSKFVEVMSATSNTKGGFSYRKAWRLYLEALKTANKWDDAAVKEAAGQMTVADIFSGQRVAIGFFLMSYLGAHKRMKRKP